MSLYGVTLKESREAYSAFNSMLGSMRASQKIKHGKELRKINHVIHQVKFYNEMNANPTMKKKIVAFEKEEKITDGK